MESIKGFSLVNWIFVILGLICAFICPAFIQPWSTLTPAGVTIFFVFVGTLLMVIGSNSLIWPIFAAIMDVQTVMRLQQHYLAMGQLL